LQYYFTRWELAGAAVQGGWHVRKNIPCQDCYALIRKGEVACITLADGAGSRDFSDLGSEVVVRKTRDFLVENFDALWNIPRPRLKRIIMEELRGELEKTAKAYDFPLGELASTLLFAATSGQKYIAGQLGDGVLACRKGEEMDIIFTPDQGEYFGSTYFTTMENASDRLRVARGYLGDITGFMLMTDGTAESLYNRKKKKLAPGARKIMDWLKTRHPGERDGVLEKTLKEVIQPRALDDCGLVLMQARKVPLGFLKQPAVIFDSLYWKTCLLQWEKILEKRDIL